MITAAMGKGKMDKYINVKSLYNQVAEKEELARQRVIDTPSRLPNGDINPYAIRYAAQLDERTTFKFMLADAPAADVVKVVRCGECRYLMQDGRCYEFADDNIKLSVSDYCSYGEKR